MLGKSGRRFPGSCRVFCFRFHCTREFSLSRTRRLEIEQPIGTAAGKIIPRDYEQSHFSTVIVIEEIGGRGLRRHRATSPAAIFFPNSPPPLPAFSRDTRGHSCNVPAKLRPTVGRGPSAGRDSCRSHRLSRTLHLPPRPATPAANPTTTARLRRVRRKNDSPFLARFVVGGPQVGFPLRRSGRSSAGA